MRKSLTAWLAYKKTLPLAPIQQYTREEVAKHSTVSDFWCILHGNVYDLTPYLEYHPGDIEVLLPYAGTDISHAFEDNHAWVNYNDLLDTCLRGFLKF